MSVEALSGIGQAVGSVGSVATESIGSVESAMPNLGESIGSLGSLSTEAISVPAAFENAFTPDISVFEKAFEPTDISVFEKGFAEPTTDSTMEITDEGFRNAIKGIDINQDTEIENVVPESFEKAFTDISVFEKAFEPEDISVFENSFATEKPEISSLETNPVSNSVDKLQADIEIPEDVSTISEILTESSDVEKLDLPSYQENFVSSIINRAEPEFHQEVLKDAQIAGKVESLLEEIGLSQSEATEIAVRSFEEAAVKKGIDLKPEAQMQTQPLTKAITETDQITSTKTEEKSKNKKREDKKSQPQENVLFVRDEQANEERKKDAYQAINKTFTNHVEEKAGIEIAANMYTPPTANETSEIVRKKSGNTDGSYEEILENIKGKRFLSKDQAEQSVNAIIDQKTAVKSGKSGKAVGEEDIKRVLKTSNITL